MYSLLFCFLSIVLEFGLVFKKNNKIRNFRIVFGYNKYLINIFEKISGLIIVLLGNKKG